MWVEMNCLIRLVDMTYSCTGDHISKIVSAAESNVHVRVPTLNDLIHLELMDFMNEIELPIEHRQGR